MENINQAEEFMKMLWQFNKMRSERDIPQPDKGCMGVMSSLFVHKEMYAHQLAKELFLRATDDVGHKDTNQRNRNYAENYPKNYF